MYIYENNKRQKIFLFNNNSLIYFILSFAKIYKFLFMILLFYKLDNMNELSNCFYNEQYLELQKNINMSFSNKVFNKKKLKIALYTLCIKNGGRARVTALFLQYLHRIKIFDLYLFTNNIKEENEYIIPKDIKRIIIKKDIIKAIKKKKIDVLINELDETKEISFFNRCNDTKVIFYHHLSTFDCLYKNYTIFKTIYQSFLHSKYVVSIIPFESDYLFKKWGIKSILMDNFITYEYKSIIQTDLSSKTIIMLGRANAKKKRFILGMQSMDYIIKEIPECELKIISNLTGINNQKYFVENINVENTEISITAHQKYFCDFNRIPVAISLSSIIPIKFCQNPCLYRIPDLVEHIVKILVKRP